jgi:hypothetical protein
MPKHRAIDLATVKTALTDFAASRTAMPHEKAECEFGELLLYLIRLAAKNGVDLIGAGERQLEAPGKPHIRIAGD